MADNAKTMPDNPVASLLLRAAEDMKAKSLAATPGPWWSDDSPECWRLHGVHALIPAHKASDGTVLIPEQVMNHQILKAPKRNTPYAEYWPGEADAAWITGMHPAVGVAVAGWLESEGETARHGVYLEGAVWMCAACCGPRTGGTCPCWNEALAVARAWLGEKTETGDGTGHGALHIRRPGWRHAGNPRGR